MIRSQSRLRRLLDGESNYAMPVFSQNVQKINFGKETEKIWDNFRGGLNTLLTPTEIEENELVQADNLQLVGKGVPTKRYGTANYFLAGSSVATASQRVRGLKYVKFASGTSGVPEILAVTDEGYLVKKSNASNSLIQGFSYSSGYPVELVQTFNNVYIANGIDALTKYSGVSIFPFTGLSVPTNLTATNISGVSGTFTYSWRISAENSVGETLASDRITLANLPGGLASTTVRLAWTVSSPLSGVAGYVVYGREAGVESFIARVPSNTTIYLDNLTIPVNPLAQTPASDSTEGPVYKYHVAHKDKLVGANVEGNPSRLIWTGGGVNIDKFHWSQGGGFVDISKDDGDVITGLIDSFDSVIVFKERSVWQVTFSASGSLVVPTVKLIMRGVGCAAHRTVKHVENDVFFLSRNGVYVLGYEPNIMNILRTNELSAKVSSFFDGISPANLHECAATYFESEYRITRPDGREIVYDRERLAWMGPNTYPASPGVYEVAYDEGNVERLLWGDRADNFVTEYSDAYNTDKGDAISTRLITKKESFGDPFLFKDLIEIFSNWRNIQGSPSVDVIVEDRTGTTTTSKSFTISATNAGSGWGFDKWGTARWGNTAGAGSGQSSNDLVRRVRMNKTVRNVQLDVSTTGVRDNYELLNLKFNLRPATKVTPGSWDVS